VNRLVNKRVIYLVVGLLAGVVAVRQAALAAQAAQAQEPGSTTPGAQAGLGTQLREFWAEVQVGMAEREQELRTALGLDGTHDMVDAHL
jgi:hypothetical protein